MSTVVISISRSQLTPEQLRTLETLEGIQRATEAVEWAEFRELKARKNQSFWSRVKDFFTRCWDALKRAVRWAKRNRKRILEGLVQGGGIARAVLTKTETQGRIKYVLLAFSALGDLVAKASTA